MYRTHFSSRTTAHRSRSAVAVRVALAVAAAGGLALGCSSEPPASSPAPPLSLGDGGLTGDPDHPGERSRVDGGFLGPDGGVLRSDRFITKVVSFTPGPCAGFGAADMPGIVLGPPVGAGELKGSLDVVSLGIGGEIVVSFEPNGIVDGPGPDFIVFENAFYAGGNPSQPAADLGEVSVSEDGLTWKTYRCTPSSAPPYGACAGWHPVDSSPANGISPVDPSVAGGEPYDLSELGLGSARFVRIRDMSSGVCEGSPKPNNSGFDLDAVSIVHALIPE